MSEYHRLELEAGSRSVAIYIDGRGLQGSRWVSLSPLDAKQFAHRLIAEAYEVERRALKQVEQKAAEEAAEEAQRQAEEEARRQADVEVPSAAVEPGPAPDGTTH